MFTTNDFFIIGQRAAVAGLAGVCSLALAEGASALAPSITNGLIVHLDADDVTADVDGNVSALNDQSGSGNNATQSDMALQPTLVPNATPTGASVIRFDSQDDDSPEHLLIGANASDFDAAEMTWFVAFRPDTTTDNRRLFTSAYLDVNPDPLEMAVSSQAWGSITSTSTAPDDDGLGYRTLARTDTAGFNAASAGGGTPTLTNTVDYFIGASFLDTATDEAFAQVTAGDGTSDTDSNTDATLQLDGHLQTLIGAQTGNDLIIDTGGWSGDLASMLIYNRRLSTNEIDTVVEELRQAYAVGGGEIDGDYNDSGLVEQGDLDQVLANWGAAFDSIPATWVNQRPTEGIVDQAELDVVLTEWGSSTAPNFDGSTVPEPGMLTVVAAGLAGLLGRRRR